VKAKALHGNGKFGGSISVATEGLRIVKEGALQAELLIAQGSALLALGDRLETDGNHPGAQEKWGEAAAKFVVPSELLDDAFITPLALTRAAEAFERLGDPVKAKAMIDQRQKQYPNFKEPE
jgi:tetratricopeptide (TPR) repeat protein